MYSKAANQLGKIFDISFLHNQINTIIFNVQILSDHQYWRIYESPNEVQFAIYHLQFQFIYQSPWCLKMYVLQISNKYSKM